MFRKNVYLAVLSSALISGAVIAEPEVTGKITYENSSFINDGSTIGTSATVSSGDSFKQELSARIYIDGELGDNAGSTYHAELQGFRDNDAVTDYKDNESYTQRDALREAYIDTSYDDWLIRAGKQQVVWGTADGMKLLDTINPTDYSEMAQNQMEDSRIPVWMLNAEKMLEDGGNFQVVVSQPRENIFAGFNRHISTAARTNYGSATDQVTANGTDQGHPFILKGVDSITGKTSGFLNGVPDLGAIAAGFEGVFTGTYLIAAGAAGNTVGSFSALTAGQPAGFNIMAAGNNAKAFTDLSSTFSGNGIIRAFATPYDFNLLNSEIDNDNPTSMFEYMDRTSFGSFAAYSGAGSRFAYDMPDDADANLGLRYKNTTEDGMNYSLNFSYAYDPNPVIDLHWANSSGTKLKVNKTTGSSYVGAANSALITLTEGSNCYGATTSSCTTSGPATLVFTERLKRAKNLGGSFDTTIETESFGPVVIRGEALYQKDVYSPVFDRGQLAIGDLVGALKMEKGDRFKYVIGADITALTNMMVSFQFIQDRNLDYVDSNLDFDGSACTSSEGANCGKYTADFATMHMSNNFNKAEKNKEFVSVYLSKPFGESAQHRWNNITILEENGGRWNRLDVEYTIDDNTIATAEYNKYWGDKNTQFGQLEKSSNIQVGLKHTF